MNLIIDFYRDLDTINLIIFWGIILVIFLLLVFAIIISNKNKKLKRIIYTKEQEIEESKNELAIKQEIIDEKDKTIINKTVNKVESKDITINRPIINEKTDQLKKDTNITHTQIEEKKEISNTKEAEITIKNVTVNELQKKEETKSNPIKEEFIVEEYIKPEKQEETKEEITIPTGPYQKNVLREMSLNQTSPIGITKKQPNPQKEILNSGFSKTTIENIEIIEEPTPIETYKNNYKEEMDNSKKMINKLYEEENKPILPEKNNYLKELSKKLEESNNNDIERTDYELKQEEDAIISYDELMQKKDSIKIEDEEDAIISIKELKNREKEKLYNITKEEENDEFISELKQFRSDL